MEGDLLVSDPDPTKAFTGTITTTEQLINLTSKEKDSYSPVAIIRNAKIWNIILLLAFFRKLSSNLD